MIETTEGQGVDEVPKSARRSSKRAGHMKSRSTRPPNGYAYQKDPGEDDEEVKAEIRPHLDRMPTRSPSPINCKLLEEPSWIDHARDLSKMSPIRRIQQNPFEEFLLECERNFLGSAQTKKDVNREKDGATLLILFGKVATAIKQRVINRLDSLPKDHDSRELVKSCKREDVDDEKLLRLMKRMNHHHLDALLGL